MSELEILMIYNAEMRGFLGYYALADNLTKVASKLLWMSTSSFLCTLASKRKSSMMQVVKSLKRGPNRFVIALRTKNGETREYELLSSTRQLERKAITWGDPDLIPNTEQYRGRTELGLRLEASECEWCGVQQQPLEVHHVRKLKDLKGKTLWERRMIERRRKTMVLCRQCHVDLHAGRLSAAKKGQGKTGEPDT